MKDLRKAPSVLFSRHSQLRRPVANVTGGPSPAWKERWHRKGLFV